MKSKNRQLVRCAFHFKHISETPCLKSISEMDDLIFTFFLTDEVDLGSRWWHHFAEISSICRIQLISDGVARRLIVGFRWGYSSAPPSQKALRYKKNTQFQLPDLRFIEGQTNCLKKRSEKLFPFSKTVENIFKLFLSGGNARFHMMIFLPRDLLPRRSWERQGWHFGWYSLYQWI